MLTFKEFIVESQTGEYLITFKENGKVVRQMRHSRDKLMKMLRPVLQKMTSSPDGVDLQILDIMQKVDSGQPKGISAKNKEIVIQKA